MASSGSTSTDKVRKEGFAWELVIENVQFTDAGWYHSAAINEHIPVPIIDSFHLEVCTMDLVGDDKYTEHHLLRVTSNKQQDRLLQF